MAHGWRLLDIDDAAGEALVRELPGTRYLRCDLLDITALQVAIDTVGREVGPVRVLVNNAANDDRQEH